MTKHVEIKILPPLYWIPSTVLMLSPHCTDVIPRMYWCYPPNVLNTLHSTEAIPPLYWCYPPLYWTTSTVLKVSPTVLKLSPTCTAVIPHSTEGNPPQYWIPSTVLMLSPTVLMLSPACTDVIPPMYWTTSTVLKLSPHSTEAIPPQYWCYPPDVLNNLQCTEQPPQYWTDVMWGGNRSWTQEDVNMAVRYWKLLWGWYVSGFELMGGRNKQELAWKVRETLSLPQFQRNKLKELVKKYISHRQAEYHHALKGRKTLLSAVHGTRT